MSPLVALLLLPLAALTLIMLLAIWALNRFAERMVGRKHRWLEEIVNTGEPPAVWTRLNAGRQARLQPPIGDVPRNLARADALRRLQDQARVSYLRRLDELVRYVETSPLVEDEETREVLLDRLATVRSAWLQRDPAAFGVLSGTSAQEGGESSN